MRRGGVGCDAVRCGEVRCSVARFGSVRCGAVRCGVATGKDPPRSYTDLISIVATA